MRVVKRLFLCSLNWHTHVMYITLMCVCMCIKEEIVEETDYCNIKVSLEDSVGALQLCLLNFSKMEW